MNNKLICCLLLDESGSMASDKLAALNGINSYIETIKQDYKEKPELGDVYFSLITFSASPNTDSIRFKYNFRHISEVEKIPYSEYNPVGGTPLLQAMGHTMKSLDNVESKNECDNPLIAFLKNSNVYNVKIVMIIQTDGAETEWNSEYSKEKITKMIKEREDRGNWTFVFLGAGIDAIAEGMKMGIDAGSSFSMNKSVSPNVAYDCTYTGAAVTTSKLRRMSVKAYSTGGFVENMKLEVEKLEKEAVKSVTKKVT